jgi:hypothetical protein
MVQQNIKQTNETVTQLQMDLAGLSTRQQVEQIQNSFNELMAIIKRESMNKESIGTKRKDDIRQDDMNDGDEDIQFSTTKYRKWEHAIVEKFGNDDQNKSQKLKPVHQNP